MFRRLILLVFICGSVHASGLADKPETKPVLLQMIRDDAIHRELDLTADQIARTRAALEEVDGPWFRVRIRPVDERIEKLAELTGKLENSLANILDESQSRRLEQLRNQALGTRMIVRDRVAGALGFSRSDRESLYEEFRKTDAIAADVQNKLNAGDIDPKKAAAVVRDAQTSERKAFTSEMSNDQRLKLAELTGNRFDFSRVKRTYPMAPELMFEGARWLQEGDFKLSDLKGKVVAVHFYAFQCINCRRNLPHYNAWHKDYADDGLVMIGIQTPETKRERDPAAVAEAMKAEGIQYSVLMDAESANWRQWSNTMWPTVYLIDKKGYLRRWWQGELNWKETPGEQQMRETIEQLLAEES